LPHVLIDGVHNAQHKSDSIWPLEPFAERRPSEKDGGRIVKSVMNYITANYWFGKQYVKRPKIEE
jgi:hypothetical protein